MNVLKKNLPKKHEMNENTNSTKPLKMLKIQYSFNCKSKSLLAVQLCSKIPQILLKGSTDIGRDLSFLFGN